MGEAEKRVDNTKTTTSVDYMKNIEENKHVHEKSLVKSFAELEPGKFRRT